MHIFVTLLAFCSLATLKLVQIWNPTVRSTRACDSVPGSTNSCRQLTNVRAAWFTIKTRQVLRKQVKVQLKHTTSSTCWSLELATHQLAMLYRKRQVDAEPSLARSTDGQHTYRSIQLCFPVRQVLNVHRNMVRHSHLIDCIEVDGRVCLYDNGHHRGP